MKFNEIYVGLIQGKKYRTTGWASREYIYYDKNRHMIVTESGIEYYLSTIQIMESDWVEYFEPVDYEKCIGCLCWFWDVDKGNSRLGELVEYHKDSRYPFVKRKRDGVCVAYKNCEPVKSGEVKFYNKE